jgi:hypothetical protein
MENPVITVANSLEPTERCGVLDEAKKALIIVLVTQGASRREAAAFVKCHHTTIGRTAARDPKFAAKLSQVEMAASLASNGLIRRAADDPKYWRAAAWMLERRNPEDYAKRDPHTFTADQVVSLLASVCSAALPTVQPEKVEEFYKFFDDAFEEVEDKTGPAANVPKARRKKDKTDVERAQSAPQNGFAANGATPSSNGHHPLQAPLAPEAVALTPEPPATPPDVASVGWPSEAVDGTTPTPSCEAIGEAANHEVGTASYEENAELDDEFDEELGTDDDDDNFSDADWDRIEALHDVECRYVSAEEVPDPQERIEANRRVRLALIARRLSEESNRQPVHHPLHRLAGGLAEDTTRKALEDIDLRHNPMSRTTDEELKGRCTNGPETASSGAVPAANAAAASG